MARVLVTGGGGMLARAVEQAFAERFTVAAYSHERLDVTDPGAVHEAVLAERPEVVVNCAAFTRVDECESQPEAAMRTNGIAVGYLGAAVPSDVLLVHLSTDFVFDGRLGRPYRECDTPVPINEYGESKLLGEKALQTRRGPWLLVRTAWLFGAGGRNFVDTIFEKAARGEPLSVVDDQRGNPTWTVDLARALVALVEAGETGIYHAAGRDDATWFDLAREVVRLGGFPVEVRPIRSRDLDRPAIRPADSRLDGSKLRMAGHEMRPWRDALREYLAPRTGGAR